MVDFSFSAAPLVMFFTLVRIFRALVNFEVRGVFVVFLQIGVKFIVTVGDDSDVAVLVLAY